MAMSIVENMLSQMKEYFFENLKTMALAEEYKEAVVITCANFNYQKSMYSRSKEHNRE